MSQSRVRQVSAPIAINLVTPAKELNHDAQFPNLRFEVEAPKESEVAVTVETVDSVTSPAILSSPINVPDDLFLRPTSAKRTVTSIRLEEAFSILEDEFMEEPSLSVPGDDQDEIVLTIPTKV